MQALPRDAGYSEIGKLREKCKAPEQQPCLQAESPWSPSRADGSHPHCRQTHAGRTQNPTLHFARRRLLSASALRKGKGLAFLFRSRQRGDERVRAWGARGRTARGKRRGACGHGRSPARCCGTAMQSRTWFCFPHGKEKSANKEQPA